MSPFSVADDNTAVYEVFRVHFDQLVTAMGTSPTALIPVLYSKGLISGTDRTNLTTLTGVGNINKATRLLTAVETTMKAEPRAARVVRELCEAVNDQPALRHVADRITAALGERWTDCRVLFLQVYHNSILSQINLLPVHLLLLMHCTLLPSRHTLATSRIVISTNHRY